MLADRWFQKDPTVVSFDNKLQYYFKTIDEVEAIPVVKDQECIRLHMGPLATSVKGLLQLLAGHCFYIDIVELWWLEH